MVECVLDKQRTDVEVGGAVVEVVDEIDRVVAALCQIVAQSWCRSFYSRPRPASDWNFGQMYVSKKKNFVMRLGSCLPMCHREELCS